MTSNPNLGHQNETACAPLLDQIRQLAEALDATDRAPGNRRTTAFGPGLEELIVVARRTVTAAEPILTGQDVLAAALHDAAEDRAQAPEWCRDCAQADDGNLCPYHAEDSATADAYDALGRALLGDRYGQY